MDLRPRFLPQGWYPDSDRNCRSEIEEFQSYINKVQGDLDQVHGGLVPHAGWYFSGRLAALVFERAARKVQPDVVALFGGHLGSGPGIIYADQAWETPLGPMPVDGELTDALANRIRVRTEGVATNDNTVEIQMPLVRYFFPDSKVLALRAPHGPEAIELGRAAAELAQEQNKTLLAFGSTDLTHYGPNYGFSPKGSGAEAVRWVREENDRGFVERALALDGPGMLDHAAKNSSACSAGGAAAAVAAGQALGADRAVLLDYYTSHDIMPGSSFVGYAGILF